MAKQIGLFGFGVVGQGYYEIAQKHQKELLPSTIVVQNKNKERDYALPFSYDPKDILEGPAELGIELISDPNEAFLYVKTLLKKGKTVISANKKMIAAHLPELLQLEKEHGGSLLYEASAAAGIPVITTLDTHFEGDRINALEGILNGSSNYILTRLFEDGLSFQDALALAQKNGFAEADPTLDINGSDVSSKLTILILHAFGQYIKEDSIATLGIQHIRKEDVELANAFGLKIKLLAKAQQGPSGVEAYILPTLVCQQNALYRVENEYNALKVLSDNLGEQFYKGKGAGSHPTGASVYADLCKAAKGYSYSYDKLEGQIPAVAHPEKGSIEVIIRSKNLDALKKLAPEATESFVGENHWAIARLSTDSLIQNQDLIGQHKISIIAINGAVALESLQEKLKGAVSSAVN
ncbi:homoserine dehydrogenase [Echinicola sediminis]